MRVFSIALLTLCACASALPASAQVPGGPPPFVVVLQGFLGAVANPAPERVRQFVGDNTTQLYSQSRTPEAHAARFAELRAMLGQAELLNLIAEAPDRRRAIVRSAVDGEQYVLLFRVTTDMPPKIVDFTIERGVATTPANAQPRTPVERAREVLDAAFNAEPAAAEGWVRTAYAPALANIGIAQHLNVLAQFRDQARAIEVVSVTASSATAATALYRSRLTGEWWELNVAVEPQAPNRLVSIGPPRFIPAPAAHAPAARTFTPQQARAALDTYARNLADADLFSGGLLVARAGQVLFNDAYGRASREFNVANTTDTRFGLGSLNKMFTAVGILQLVEQGKLSLNDPVSQHLPGVLPDSVAARIRIEHLLTHTSGLGDFIFTPVMMNRSRQNYRDIADYLPSLADVRLPFEPGTRWSYSNTGYLVLGAIIERISGMSYDEYVQRNVFDRAGMTQTSSPAMDLVPVGFAGSYQREFDRGRPLLRNDRYLRPVRGTPAGGGFSTGMDLFRFYNALLGNRLLSAEMTRTMLRAKPELNSPNYGYGTQIFAADGNRFGHTGGGPGTATFVEYDVKSDLIVIVLGNMNTGSPAVLTRARQIYGVQAPVQSW